MIQRILPCSLEMSGLYQNLDVSWTNLTLSLLSGLPSARNNKKCHRKKGTDKGVRHPRTTENNEFRPQRFKGETLIKGSYQVC